MFFSNIKDRRLPVLEQACERYALMVYEVFRGSVAYGFKSIRYSYKNSKTRGRGTFTATFMPFGGVETNCKATRITFVIESKSFEDIERVDVHPEIDEWWEFSNCKIDDLDGFSRNSIPVRFTEDGHFVVIILGGWSDENIYTVGNSPISHAICSEVELKSKYKLSDILIV